MQEKREGDQILLGVDMLKIKAHMMRNSRLRDTTGQAWTIDDNLYCSSIVREDNSPSQPSGMDKTKQDAHECISHVG